MRGCERSAGRDVHRREVRGRADGGFVTAETAVVLPVLVVFAMALVWALLVVAAQIQCVDAARTGARAAARQDSADAVVQVAREAAPNGARVTVAREADRVRVVVVAASPLLHGLPFEVREEAVASVEQTVSPVVDRAGDPTVDPAADPVPGRTADAPVDESAVDEVAGVGP
ncbi:TadE family type IV pilus minor pilin [Streptomyces sp. CL12-4]|uniref:TadE family type IV pilus minor pilin n=1 Tax=Streptomyces sp. CL12-4 TaxID=2810306 RepID=UPI001EFC1250|nr:TadE family type IV pilus minor pilin [Streptomyces sp. CL12-4]MCG8966117.1 pilus assembly protein [Streptomyces sp. CL12-4]